VLLLMFAQGACYIGALLTAVSVSVSAWCVCFFAVAWFGTARFWRLVHAMCAVPQWNSRPVLSHEDTASRMWKYDFSLADLCSSYRVTNAAEMSGNLMDVREWPKVSEILGILREKNLVGGKPFFASFTFRARPTLVFSTLWRALCINSVAC